MWKNEWWKATGSLNLQLRRVSGLETRETRAG